MGFFKAYDLRGTFKVDFDLDTVFNVGRALPGVVPGSRWLIGRDCRLSSPAVRDALVRGLNAAGATVTDLGECTTPMVYYFTAADGFDGSVMITASHNPPTDNGLKVSRRGALPVGYADGLNRVEALLDSQSVSVVESSAAVVTLAESASVRERYLEFLRSRVAPSLTNGKLPIKLGIDCSNGMASLLVKELFSTAQIINLGCDGSFPAHSPNPLVAEARTQLADLVRREHLDVGIIFDGDADRAMFLDERGTFVQSDYLIPVIARSMRQIDGDFSLKVLHDVRTSRGAIETLVEDGFQPVMVPVGHAFAKPQMRSHHARCGGELAGHYYFGDFFGCDSGLLASLRVLAEIVEARAAGLTFSQMMAPIVSRYANSGELNFKVADKDAATERVLAVAARELPPERSRSTMDGVRVEYDEGWFNIRKSNTEPYLRLLAEAKTPALLARWLQVLTDAIQG